MFDYYGRDAGPTVPARSPQADVKPAIADGVPANPSSRDTRNDGRKEDLREILRQDWAVLELQIAEIIYAVDRATGDRCGLFYGDPTLELEPIDPFWPWKKAAVLEVRVDRDRDDRQVLVEAVERVRRVLLRRRSSRDAQ